MRKIFALTSLAAALSLPLIAGPTDANASCRGRKDTGTIIGGVGGALLGNAVAGHGGKAGGTIIGGLGGAVIGHQIAKSGCHGSRHAYYRPSRYRYADRARYSYAAETPQPARRMYYDQYGNAVVSPQPYYR